MVYMISDRSVSFIKQYLEKVHLFQSTYDTVLRKGYEKLPAAAQAYGMEYPKEAYEEFGFDFDMIEPFKMRAYLNRKEVLRRIVNDIDFMSFCYNMPLNIYIGSDRWYEKELSHTHAVSFTCLGKSKELQFDHYEVMIPNDSRYYSGDIEELNRSILDHIQHINMKVCPFWHFILSQDGIRQCDKDVL